MIAIIESTMYVVLTPIVRLQRPLKSRSPVNSQASPIMIKECALSAPRMVQIRIAGIHPVPPAFPAARAKMPAPATLLTKLKTDDAMEVVPQSDVFFFEAPPRSAREVSIDVRCFNLDGRWWRIPAFPWERAFLCQEDPESEATVPKTATTSRRKRLRRSFIFAVELASTLGAVIQYVIPAVQQYDSVKSQVAAAVHRNRKILYRILIDHHRHRLFKKFRIEESSSDLASGGACMMGVFVAKIRIRYSILFVTSSTYSTETRLYRTGIQGFKKGLGQRANISLRPNSNSNSKAGNVRQQDTGTSS